jgi:hypothetical protein
MQDIFHIHFCSLNLWAYLYYGITNIAISHYPFSSQALLKIAPLVFLNVPMLQCETLTIYQSKRPHIPEDMKTFQYSLCELESHVMFQLR